MTKKVYAIARPEDFEEVDKRILSDLNQGRITFFALVVADDTGFSCCFFAPAAMLKRAVGTLFVVDYEKITRLLLSHPKVRHVEYDPMAPAITALFVDPYSEE